MKLDAFQIPSVDQVKASFGEAAPIFESAPCQPYRKVVTPRLMGDPPADLAQRRAEAEQRAGVPETLRYGPRLNFKGRN